MGFHHSCGVKLITMYVCMYLLIAKGQSAQKRLYWGEDRIKRKILLRENVAMLMLVTG